MKTVTEQIVTSWHKSFFLEKSIAVLLVNKFLKIYGTKESIQIGSGKETHLGQLSQQRRNSLTCSV
jgi:hypothetical protein